MPEKQLDKEIFIIIAFMSVIGTLANALSQDEKPFKNFGHFFIQSIVGALCGIIFGFLTCWIIGENVYAVGGISGIGAVAGINGVRLLANLTKKYLEIKYKK
jgi:hypothetical protein